MFWFFLASRVEHTVDIDSLKRRTSSKTFERWKAYYKFEPFGDDWYQTAIVATAACNPHIKKPIQVRDLIPTARNKRTVRQQQDEFIRFLDSLNKPQS